MTPTNLLELCRNGDPSAIATLLNRGLQGKNVAATADWQGGQLNIRFESEALPSQPRLLAFLRRTMKTLRVEEVEALRVYAYTTHNPVPIWTYQMNLKVNGKGSALK